MEYLLLKDVIQVSPHLPSWGLQAPNRCHPVNPFSNSTFLAEIKEVRQRAFIVRIRVHYVLPVPRCIGGLNFRDLNMFDEALVGLTNINVASNPYSNIITLVGVAPWPEVIIYVILTNHSC